MTSNISVDWTPKKRNKIIVLPESGFSYAEVGLEVGVSVITSEIRKLSLRYQRQIQQKTKQEKAEKGAPHLMITEE